MHLPFLNCRGFCSIFIGDEVVSRGEHVYMAMDLVLVDICVVGRLGPTARRIPSEP